MTLQLTGTNRNGSPEISLSGGNSSILSWSPFGGSAARTGNTTSLQGFNGERQDPFSGVTHLGNGYRAYSPALHRFTCPDSASPFGGGGINPYAYCNHDPVNNTDPSGHMPKTAAEMELATRTRRMALRMPSAQAESLPVSLPQPSTRTSGTASAAAGASGYSSGVTERRAAPASAAPGYTPGQRDAALRLYSTNVGAAHINAAARTENGMKLTIPELKGSLANAARAEYTRSHKDSMFGRLGSSEELGAAGQIIQSSPASAVALMKEAVSKAPKAELRTYYRGTFSTPVLKKLEEGDYIKTNFFMSVIEKEDSARAFASGKYSYDKGDGVIYAIIGTPKSLPAGGGRDFEGVFNTGTIFEFISKNTDKKCPIYSFSERKPNEVAEGGKIYKLFR